MGDLVGVPAAESPKWNLIHIYKHAPKDGFQYSSITIACSAWYSINLTSTCSR